MNTEVIRVLLIEDNSYFVQVLQELFKEVADIDFEVIHRKTLQEGLNCLKEKHFDVLLLDLTLPDSHGVDTFRRAKKHSPEIPIVILTGLSDDFIGLQAVKEGIQDFLPKGEFDGKGLMRSLRYAIERKKVEREVWVLSQKLQELVVFRSSELKETRENYHALVQALPDIIFKLNPEGEFIFVNDAIKSLGYTPEELMGKHFSKIVHPEDFKKVSRTHVLPKYKGKVTGDEKAPKIFDERRSGNRKTSDLEIRLIRKDGKNLINDTGMIGSVTAFGEVCSRGQYETSDSARESFLGSVGIIRDITGRKKTERAIHHIVKGTSGVVGEEFFSSLVGEISFAIQVNFVMIAQWKGPDKREFRSLALWSDKEIKENRDFLVEGSIFQEVRDSSESCYYPQKVSELFPSEPLLSEKESFLAIPLLNHRQDKIGFKWKTGRFPLTSSHW